MKPWLLVAIGVLSGVIGCADGGGPLAPSPVVVDETGPSSGYVGVHRGRCPADADLPFSMRENGWYWPDTCRNNHAIIVRLKDWCSGTRHVARDSCVLNSPTTSTPTTSALTVTGPTNTVPDNACVVYSISGGTAPYQLTSHGGRWMTSAPCRGDISTRHTLLGPGPAVWSATGLDVGDSAQVTVTDADRRRPRPSDWPWHRRSDVHMLQ